MPVNSFSKEERVAFEQLLEGFNDELAASRLVKKYQTDQTMMARASDTIWRPMPYIMPSFDGTDASANFSGRTQLSVPASINIRKNAPWLMTADELRDALQEKRLGDGAKQKLASDINVSVLDVISDQATIFAKRSGAASGFADLAECESLFNELGVPQEGRKIGLSTRDYNNMADDLSKASRSLNNEISVKALRKAFVGELASFDTYKFDYAKRKAAALGSGLTFSTLAAGANVYVPRATSVASTGQGSNVDNRTQLATFSETTNMAAGDAFTVADVYAVHPITKRSTGRLKTFRVIEVVSGTTAVISPPMISAQNGEIAAVQYQNCVVEATSATAAVVFLNTVVGAMNPFWVEGCCEILPGRIPVDPGSGVEVLRGSTDQGIEIVMTKFTDINTLNVKYRIDAFWGVVLLNPEMAGIVMFSQT
jgi:hypothetical protein